jgi:hypothetical protein
MSPLAKALVALVALASVAELAAGKNYTIQWAASGNSYGDWSAANPVRVGDTVGELLSRVYVPQQHAVRHIASSEIFTRAPIGAVFTYVAPHTVDELSQPDYEACNFDKPMSQDDSGRTAITFHMAGTRYFACAAGSHCNQGQKVAITVAAGGGGAQSPPVSSPPAAPKGNSACADGRSGWACSEAGAGTGRRRGGSCCLLIELTPERTVLLVLICVCNILRADLQCSMPFVSRYVLELKFKKSFCCVLCCNSCFKLHSS